MNSDEIKKRKERYQRIERHADVLGRVIGVRRLKPSQRLMVEEMAPALDGAVPTTDPETGQIIAVPKNSPLLIAASVCEISEEGQEATPIPFPKNRAELNAILDRLDTEGLEAAAAGLGAFAKEDAGTPDIEGLAKN